MRAPPWKEGKVLSLKLRDSLYTVCHMSIIPELRIYDIFNSHGHWDGLDLTKVKVLFQVSVGRVVLQNLVSDVLNEMQVRRPKFEFQRKWIKPYLNDDRKGFIFKGGRLIELDDKHDDTSAPILKENLQVETDRSLIESTEMTNMWGHRSLAQRLCRYVDTGIDRDDLKFEVFPGLWNDREQLSPLTCRLPNPLRLYPPLPIGTRVDRTIFDDTDT